MFHKRLVLVTIVHGIFSSYVSIQSLTVNYLEPVLKPFVNASFFAHYNVVLSQSQFSWLWSCLAASNSVGILLGAFAMAALLEQFGRRDTSMLIRNTIGLLGFAAVILSKPANSFELLIFGHMLGGASYALNAALILYISECTPDRYRGIVSLAPGVGLQLWVVIGAVLALPQVFGTSNLWPFYPIVGAMPALVHYCFSWTFPRSPKFLYIAKDQRKMSSHAISYFHGDAVDTDDVMSDYDREAALASTSERTADWATIWRRSHLRVPFLICLVAGIAPAFSGIGLRSQYSVIMLQTFAIPIDAAMLLLIILNSIALPFTFLAPVLVEKTGRRSLFLVCVGCGCLSLVFMFVAELSSDKGASAQLSAAFGIVGFVLGMASTILGLLQLPQLLVGEMCPQASRAKAGGAGAVLAIVATILTVVTYPPLDNAIGAYCYLPMVILEAVCFGILVKFLPETRNQPVDEIVTQFMSRRQTMEPEFAETDPLLSPGGGENRPTFT